MHVELRLFGKTIFRAGSPATPPPAAETANEQPQASDIIYPKYSRVFAVPFDGEKNLGELGPIRKYVVNHDALRLRSWQLFLESEICQTVFKRYGCWVIGEGLKLQSEPKTAVLETEKIAIDSESFNNAVEERFKVFSESTLADFAGMKTLHEIADSAFLNALAGGDVLVIARATSDSVNVQLVDGAHVGTPPTMAMVGNAYVAANGNLICNGIEKDKTGRHVAYYVRTVLNEYRRIPARNPVTGEIMVFMVYGMTYRLDNDRGIPVITAVMETAKKMERYKEATVGSAEERQKIAFTIEHDASSTGKNPMIGNLAKISGFAGDDIPTDDAGRQLANTVAATTNKQTFNMPIGSKMTQLASTNELQFKDFYGCNIDIVCATVGIPPNVAMSKYDSNFSASRAALKDWEHTLAVERKRFANQFYQKIYNLWLTMQVYTNKIQAPGYLTALETGNTMALNAYRSARWVGANVPHIDPEKEVRAERLKLGGLGANLPLTTQEAATEVLNGGDSKSNTTQFGKELERGEENGIDKPAKEAPPETKPEDPDEGK